MSQPIGLDRLEAVVDASGMASVIEAVMPSGGRPRQLGVRALLVGLLLTISDDRPVHLCRVHAALVGLGHADQVRLGILVRARRGPHRLTYRQVERTFSTMVRALAMKGVLDQVCDSILEASIPEAYKAASSARAVDWTDHPSWARPPTTGGHSADPDAGWGHRNVNTPGTKEELFFGYYASLVTMVAEESGPAVPGLVRRVLLDSPGVDPVPAMAKALVAMAEAGIAAGDVLADSGYSYRLPEHWADPLRAGGYRLVVDLHPADRGPKGTYEGALVANGNLYCPATPAGLVGMAPLGRGASPEEIDAFDRRCEEAGAYKLGPISSADSEGYYRLSCPAAAGKLRCPLKAASMSLALSRPEVLAPPPEAPRCCTQASITVPPSVNAKTRQKHDYPSAAHRRSFARRTAAERSFSITKNTAGTDMRRGWCRMVGRAKNLLVYAAAAVVANLRCLSRFGERQAQESAPSPRRSRRRRSGSPGA